MLIDHTRCKRKLYFKAYVDKQTMIIKKCCQFGLKVLPIWIEGIANLY